MFYGDIVPLPGKVRMPAVLERIAGILPAAITVTSFSESQARMATANDDGAAPLCRHVSGEKRGSRRDMKALQRIIKGDMHGIHYAVSIFIATAVLWLLVHELAERDPIWAISSMVATSDPLMKQAMLTFRARIINSLVGCAIGLLFIAIGGTRLLMLPLAMAVTVLVSSYVVRIQTMWRQVPISAAFVIAAGLEYHSRKHGLIAGVGRMNEVLFGCVVGLVIAWLVSVVWPLPSPAPVKQPAAK